MPTRVIVTGSRHWDCWTLAMETVARCLRRYGADLIIVHGGARGVDSAFDRAAKIWGVRCEPHPARWTALGSRSVPIRNQTMVDSGVHFCLAVHKDLARAKGTRDCVRRCLAAGIPVWLIEREGARPRRIPSL